MKMAMVVPTLAMALLVGCASTPRPASTAPAATPVATAEPAAPILPRLVPAASARRVVLTMSGPDAVTKAKDWPAFKEEWRATFAEHAKAAGVAFDMAQGDAPAAAQSGTLLNVYVNDYRMVGIGARIFFGVMTGNAYIDAKATFADLNGGSAFGDRTYNTSSSARQGIFGKMTPQQVDAIATQVFGELPPR
jgi:hypothetical protein